MSRLKSRLFGALSIGVLALGALGASPVHAGGSGGTLMVDDDGQAKPGKCGASGPASNAAYSTIQSAVLASSAGDTIWVCPGDYTENLVIRKHKDDLSLRSVKPWQARIWRPISLDGDIPLVHIKPGADGVSFVHFALVFPTTDDCDQATAAAILVEGTNASIRGNRIHSDGPDDFYTCGYYDGIAVTANNVPPPGPITASATPAAINAPASAFVGFNLIRDFQNAGIIAGSYTHARVTTNSVHFGHQDSGCSFTSAATAAAPAGSVCFGWGILYYGGARGTVDENYVVADPSVDVTSTQTAGNITFLLVGISIGGYSTPAGKVKVLGNHVGLAVEGITLGGTDQNIVHDNYVSLSFGTGIYVDGTNADIRRNQVYNTITGNGGLYASGNSEGNLFKNNRALDNSVDCNDDTGPTVGSLDNTWVQNVGDTSDPSGLCTPES